MPNWKHTFDVQEKWELAKDHEIAPCELSKYVAEKIETDLVKHFPNDGDLTCLMREFRSMGGDEHIDVDDFDLYWQDFYDWADTKRVWIKTAF